MASSKDFTANQIRVAKLILTGTQPGDGGVGTGKIGLSIYDESIASDDAGSVSDAAIYSNLGDEVSIFVSGAAAYDARDKNSTHVLFRGNLGTSGSMHFMNPNGVAATTTISLGASTSKSSYNSDTIRLIDSDGTNQLFTVNVANDTTTGGNIGLASDANVEQIAASFVAAINSIANLDIVASPAVQIGAGGVDAQHDILLTQGTDGPAGDTTVTVSETGGHLSCPNFTGGVNGNNSAFIFADNARPKHLYLSGTLYAGGHESDTTPYGTISGSIQKTRDGLDYIKVTGGLSATSGSDGTITIDGSGAGGGSTLAFKTIAVSGQTDVVANSSTDTLNLAAAGDGLTITTNAGSDTVTFTSAYRPVEVDENGNGSADETLGGSETLRLKAGTNMTLAEAGGIVTFNASGGGGGAGVTRYIFSDDGPDKLFDDRVISGSDASIFRCHQAANVPALSVASGDPDIKVTGGVTVTPNIFGTAREFFSQNKGTTKTGTNVLPEDLRVNHKGAAGSTIGFRFVVPDGATNTTNVKFKIRYSLSDNAGGEAGTKVEMRLAGRLSKDAIGADVAITSGSAVSGAWRDVAGTATNANYSPDGWLYFKLRNHAPAESGQEKTSGFIDISGKNTSIVHESTSQTFQLKDLVNTADAAAAVAGAPIEMLLMRNATLGGASAAHLGDYATATITVDGSGAINGVSVVKGGSNYKAGAGNLLVPGGSGGANIVINAVTSPEGSVTSFTLGGAGSGYTAGTFTCSGPTATSDDYDDTGGCSLFVHSVMVEIG